MKRIFFCVLVLCAGLAACTAQSSSQNSTSNTTNANASATASVSQGSLADQTAVATTVGHHGGGGGGGGGGRTEEPTLKQNVSLMQSSQNNTTAADRKIIRNAELNLEADDPEAAQRSITTIAESKGGFVVESQQSSSDIQSTAGDVVMMSVRVPSEKFSETLDEMRNIATRVVVETVKGEDVTEEFIDIEAQLKAKKALEEQFMSIMKRANTVKDALSVQSQLAEVRGEIEQIEGRKRFLENQSSLSTIKIRLQTPKVFAASSTGFGTRLSDSFSSGFDVALNFILGLVTFVIAALPFAVFVGLPLFAIIRYVVRRQSTPKSITQIAEEEITSA